MKYNVINIIDSNLDDDKVKKIVNKKLYKIIELLEFETDYDK